MPRRAIRFGDFELDLRSAELRKRDGATERLAEQPFRILLALLEHPHEVVLREELRKQLWPNNTIVEFEHSINASVNRLRRVLGDSADQPRFIETLARRGYRWMVPIKWYEAPHAPGAGQPPAAANPIGGKVSHYRLLEVLGGGGMGVVYKAEDLKLGRHVAVKFLGEEFFGDHRAIERFEREARTLSALDHPNICAIYEVAEHQGHPFLVMQYLQGQTLRQRIESVPMSRSFTLAEMLDITGGILAGLEAAHEKGVIHRDVKPANIFLSARGEVKLLDFGLAKLVADAEAAHSDFTEGSGSADTHSTSLTLTGITMGTASYMAPEQVRCEPVDARTDLFSLGVVLYEMATGNQPFRGATLEEIHAAILTSTPSSPLKLNPVLPAGFSALIEQLLQKDPERRFQSARDVTEKLNMLRPAVSETSMTRALAVRARVPRHMRTIFGAVALALSLIAIVAWVLLKWKPTAAPQAEHLVIQKLTDSGRVDAVAISHDGSYLAYAQRDSKGAVLWLRELTSGKETLLVPPSEGAGHYLGLTFSPDGAAVYFVRAFAGDSGFHYLYAVPTRGGPARLVLKDLDSPPGFSPGGRRFAYTRGVSVGNAVEIRIANADGSADHLLASVPETNPEFQPGATWSPDGRIITVPLLRFHDPSRYALYKVDPLSGVVAELTSSAFRIGRALWLPGGNGMLLMLWDHEHRGQLWAMSYPRIQSRRLVSDLTDYDYRADLDADGGKLAAVARTTYANLWTTSAADDWHGRQLTTLSLPLSDVIEGPDGELLANGGDHIWRFSADGQQRKSFTALDTADTLARCGRYVVVSSNRGNGIELLRFNADGSRALILTARDPYLPVCSPDGKYVYYLASLFGGIWRVATGGGRPQEIGPELGYGPDGRISISADGRSIAYTYFEYKPVPRTRFALVSAENGTPQHLLDLPSAAEHIPYRSPLLAPDGRSVDYLITRNGVSNVWEQDIDGGGRSQLTHFTSGRIFGFNWSRDGKTLLLTRGEMSSDAVLISNIHSGLDR